MSKIKYIISMESDNLLDFPSTQQSDEQSDSLLEKTPTKPVMLEAQGNLLIGSNPEFSVIQINEVHVPKAVDSDGKLEILTQDGKGKLRVYTQDFQAFSKGDFIFLSQADAEPAQFTYILQDKSGTNTTLTLTITMTENGPLIGTPDYSYIDEEGLLPGAQALREAQGYLGLPSNEAVKIKFNSIENQNALADLALKSKGVPLYYLLSQDKQTLTAKAGANGPTIFTVALDNSGTYSFKLHGPIDRNAPKNLVNNSTLMGNNQEIPGWHNQTLIENHLLPMMILFQQIETQQHSPYQLTFYYEPKNGISLEHPIQVMWGDQLIHNIPAHQQSMKGYTFSVDGEYASDNTKLEFVTLAQTHPISDFIHNVSVTSATQNKLPIDFNFLVTDNDNQVSQSHFTVNITTTYPIELNNQAPFDIMYEQAVYQTIVVSDENPHANPLATINLDALFKNLSIPAENRVVEVVQLQEDGLATNVYEVKISNKSETLEPITVADVKLSFPGGDGGLSVFQKNILIDEGSDIPLPHTEHIT